MCCLHSTITEYTESKVLEGLHDKPQLSHSGMSLAPFQWGTGYTVEGAAFAFLSISLCVLLCPQIGDHKFSAHRIVLAASIPYFHAMFTNDMMECKQDEIVMQGMDPRYQTPPLGLLAASRRALCLVSGAPRGACSRTQHLWHSSIHACSDRATSQKNLSWLPESGLR